MQRDSQDAARRRGGERFERDRTFGSGTRGANVADLESMHRTEDRHLGPELPAGDSLGGGDPMPRLVQAAAVEREPRARHGQPPIRLHRLDGQRVEPRCHRHEPPVVEEAHPVVRDQVGGGLEVTRGRGVMDGIAHMPLSAEPFGGSPVQLGRQLGLGAL